MNMFHIGGKKIEHPSTEVSNVISQDVEALHKQFTEFHKNLNNLVMIYRTRHQLMDALNENGLYVSLKLCTERKFPILHIVLTHDYRMVYEIKLNHRPPSVTMRCSATLPCRP
jgi:hypothetical protein